MSLVFAMRICATITSQTCFTTLIAINRPGAADLELHRLFMMRDGTRKQSIERGSFVTMLMPSDADIAFCHPAFSSAPTAGASYAMGLAGS
jgi:hypothetical protein